MKKFLLLVAFYSIVLTQPSVAQKHDYMWPLGLGAGLSEYSFFYDFKTDEMVVRQDTARAGWYSSSYSDKDGNIQFFSNGLKIYDQNGDFVENSDGLNPTVPEWQAGSYYPSGQMSFFLEKPDNPAILYFISLDIGPHPAQKWPYMFTGKNLLVATIDVQANNGLGKVIEKNRVLLTGILMSPAACRHANGRDWWILVSDADENRHYRILLSPEGFSLPETQLIGSKPNPIPFEGGNKSNQIVGNTFSPSGNYYVDINDLLGFSVFGFDRCSGLLSNEKRENLPPNPFHPNRYPYNSGTGAVFSPNERYFYRTTSNDGGYSIFTSAGTLPYLFQYDLNAPDISLTRDTINVIDSADYHLPFNITWEVFRGAELGPDGRIYIVHSGLGYSTVQYPNEKGKACKLIHDMPFFDVVIGSAIPYMPNYRLGPLDGSACDTLGLNNIPVAHFRIDDSLDLYSRFFYDLSHHEPASWHWQFGDGQSSSAQNPLHTYDSAGVYNVCLTVSNAYGSDTQCRTVYVGVSSTDVPENEVEWQLYPNPASGFVTLEYAGNAPLKGPLLLFNALGQLVQTVSLPQQLAFQHRISLAGLPEGVYGYVVAGMPGLGGKLLVKK
ncbi:MAG TPA: hypothetical protein DCF33_11350 [Saprospirales bacterium]|nr:hypothetical protein [Saprospirales bacterium]